MSESRPTAGRNVESPEVEPSSVEAKAEPSTPDTRVESEKLPNGYTLTENEKGYGNAANGAAGDTRPEDEEIVYPSGLALAAIVLALCLAVFLVALDQTIIATAIPRITDDFQSVKDIGWYGAVRPYSLHFHRDTHIVLGIFLDVYFSTT
jgi:hypothetical protein